MFATAKVSLNTSQKTEKPENQFLIVLINWSKILSKIYWFGDPGIAKKNYLLDKDYKLSYFDTEC